MWLGKVWRFSIHLLIWNLFMTDLSLWCEKLGNDFRYAEAVSLFGSDFGTWRFSILWQWRPTVVGRLKMVPIFNGPFGTLILSLICLQFYTCIFPRDFHILFLIRSSCLAPTISSLSKTSQGKHLTPNPQKSLFQNSNTSKPPPWPNIVVSPLELNWCSWHQQSPLGLGHLYERHRSPGMLGKFWLSIDME